MIEVNQKLNNNKKKSKKVKVLSKSPDRKNIKRNLKRKIRNMHQSSKKNLQNKPKY